MSLTPENLVGYLRAEFAKAARLRLALFVFQLAAALPGAIAVVVPHSDGVTLYILAIVGVVLIVIWWVLKNLYASAQSAAQAARRGALLLGGLNQPLSPSEVQSLRERFTVTAEQARQCEMADYYTTRVSPGPARLAEMLEESALYSEHLQRISANVMLVLLVIFTLVFLGTALGSLPYVERGTGLVIVRVILAIMVFVLSADVLGAYRDHRTAEKEIKSIRQRLMTADRAGYPLSDVLLAFVDYNAAVQSAPESVPFVYKWFRKDLNQRWEVYQSDRAAARESRA